jgi:hypothetical protein
LVDLPPLSGPCGGVSGGEIQESWRSKPLFDDAVFM